MFFKPNFCFVLNLKKFKGSFHLSCYVAMCVFNALHVFDHLLPCDEATMLPTFSVQRGVVLANVL